MVAAAERPMLWPGPAQATYDKRLTTNVTNWQPAAEPTVQPTIISLAPPAKRWMPRSKEGYVAWDADLSDRLSTSGLLLTSKLSLPTFEMVAQARPDLDHDHLYDMYFFVVERYNDLNTQVYHTVMSNIDLSGPCEEADLNYIAQHFHSGMVRDGHGLLCWLKNLHHSWCSEANLPNVEPWVDATTLQGEQQDVDVLSAVMLPGELTSNVEDFVKAIPNLESINFSEFGTPALEKELGGQPVTAPRGGAAGSAKRDKGAIDAWMAKLMAYDDSTSTELRECALLRGCVGFKHIHC